MIYRFPDILKVRIQLMRILRITQNFNTLFSCYFIVLFIVLHTTYIISIHFRDGRMLLQLHIRELITITQRPSTCE